jgi:uncharacterized Zn finger protein
VSEVEFVTCPKCRSRNWDDMLNKDDADRLRYRCVRCGYTMYLGQCGTCKTDRAWELVKGVDPKGGYRPYYRYRCRGCGRVIGILMG